MLTCESQCGYYSSHQLTQENNKMIEAGKTKEEAVKFAKEASIENPDCYVTLFSCFGIFVKIHKRLNVFGPSDSLFGIYWLNGKEKTFTAKQKIAAEKATPSLY